MNLPRYMVRTALFLAFFASISTGLVAITQQLTKEKIRESEKRALLRNLSNVVDPQLYNNEIFTDITSFQSQALLGSKAPVAVFRARHNDAPIAAIFTPIAPDGYSGKIKLLVGILYDGTISGVRVLDHRETPGLGDFIEKRRSDWILSFDQKSLKSTPKKQWAVKRDGGMFDQFTGATITPRAIVKAVHKCLQYYNQNRELIFKQAISQTIKP